MSVLERTTEIGTSLAIGLRSSEIMRLFLLEGILIGIAGGAVVLDWAMPWEQEFPPLEFLCHHRLEWPVDTQDRF